MDTCYDPDVALLGFHLGKGRTSSHSTVVRMGILFEYSCNCITVLYILTMFALVILTQC